MKEKTKRTDSVAEETAEPVSGKLETLQKKKKRKGLNVLCNVLIVVFSALFVFSAVKLVQIQKEYSDANSVISAQQQYKPQTQVLGEMVRPARPVTEQRSGEASTSEETPSDAVTEEPTVVNPTIVKLQANYPDICGWITLDGTDIDYLYAKGTDNKRYERKDLDGNYLVAGTLFLDYRSTRDFTSFNTVLYGHNMRNGTMFGDLDYYEKTDFFNENKTGTVYLADATYGLEIFALLVVPSDDAIIYNSYTGENNTDEAKMAFLNYVKKNARQYREVGVTKDDTILTLSTCSYEYDGARYVLLARLMEYGGADEAVG